MDIITGGQGFIGSHLWELLPNALVVDNLSHSYHPLPKPFLRYRLGSFSYLPKEIETIYHLAADISVKESMENPQKVLSNNLQSTLEVAEWARKKDAKIVFASSAAVYASKEGALSEGDPLQPQSIYGLSKKQDEEILYYYHKLYGIDVIILRYANVYGPRQDPQTGPVIPTFITRMLKGQEIFFYGDGSQARDFIYVKDVARITKQASSLKGYQVFNVGTGKPTTIKELFSLLASMLGYQKEPVIKEERPGDIKTSFFDIQRLFYKDFVPLEEGLRRTIAYYKTNP
ncbi:MAG: NAD-dependent epimerase/dehydratase family protein [Candidatus Micrarchaeota archaeon]|nr:NAD-dependent epimerase/dehydratase family protein [Candidatus Micrarchaeota archaeon]